MAQQISKVSRFRETQIDYRNTIKDNVRKYQNKGKSINLRDEQEKVSKWHSYPMLASLPHACPARAIEKRPATSTALFGVC